MNMKKKRYITIAGILIILVIALSAVLYIIHFQQVEESPLHLLVSAYQKEKNGWISPEDTLFEPGSGEEIFLRGMEAFDQKDYTVAKQLFSQALEESGSDPALPAYLYFYLNRCDVQLDGVGNRETVSLALEAIRDYLPLINETEILWALIGSISLSTENDDEAIELIEEHMEKAEGQLELSTWAYLKNCIAMLQYNNREYAKSIRGFYDVEAALENMEMNLQLEIEYRYAKEYIANIYFIFEDYEKAAAMYQELINLAADDEVFHAYACCINMASAYLEISDTKKARASMEELEKYLPQVDADLVSEVEASMNDVLASICLMEGDLEGADTYLRYAEKFYQVDRGNAAFWGSEYFIIFTRCKYMFKTGEWEEAQRILEEMIESGNAAYYGMEESVCELLRDIYQSTGQNEKLVQVYQRLLKLDTDFSQTTQREYLEFSAYYKDNNDLINYTTSLSRKNTVFSIIIATVLVILMVILILLRLISKKNVTDQLTGIYNRKKMNQLLRKYKRSGTPANLGIVMIDIDYFKRYNDTYGHLAGDEILKQVAKVLSASLRSKDIVIRYGGEEFLILLKDIPEKVAEDVCLRIHENLRKRAILHAASEVSEYVTLSIGLCYQEQAGAASLDKLIEYADECLYQSKEAGRNRVTAKHI
ncbi:MAG: diguanylate cyclase [Lachnospiraceae bacterium]|nr:diguanylate cyclase [Lachnospiraceae bacterium]